MSDVNSVDHGRRRMLLRLGLSATAAYAAPAFVQLGGARASSISSVSFSPPSGPSAPDSVAPGIVVTARGAGDIDAIAAQDYRLLARDRLALAEAENARFSVPAGVTVEQTRLQILDLVPAATFDLNHLYQPGDLACGVGDCAAFDMIGWQTAAASCPAGTTIGMVDTGVNTEHAALSGVDVETLQVTAEGRTPASAVHGTAIAVLLAGRQDTRTPGASGGRPARRGAGLPHGPRQ